MIFDWLIMGNDVLFSYISRLSTSWCAVIAMFQLCQAIYTGYPQTKCNQVIKPLVNFANAYELEFCDIQKNCLLYSYENITVRITKSGCIKIHFSRKNICKYNSKHKLKIVIEKIVSKLSYLFYNTCLISYRFSTNNIHFKGRLVDVNSKQLFEFCLTTFSTASVFVGQIDPLLGSTITYVKIVQVPQTSVIYTKVKVQETNFCITISRSAKFTGIAKSIVVFNRLKHILDET